MGGGWDKSVFCVRVHVCVRARIRACVCVHACVCSVRERVEEEVDVCVSVKRSKK